MSKTRTNVTEEQAKAFLERLPDPLFRLAESRFYWIVSKKKERGRDTTDFEPFVPYPHQMRVLHALYKEGKRRLLIPKARRMGFSTVINLAQLDFCLNNRDFHSRIVDQSENDAKDKLVNRVQKSYEKLNQIMPTGLATPSWSNEECKWSNGSRFTASISGRGSEAAHFLHVSELGPIDFKDSKRADEIIDGAFPAADAGIIIVESTAKGPVGHFKRLVDNALEVAPEDRTEYDWDVLFFAWHDDPRHVLDGSPGRIKADTNKYLDYIENEIGRKFTLEQRIWYQVTKDRTKEMRYEYPSILEECWEQPIEGAIYARAINKARSEGRIGKFPYEKRLPVYTSWDLGAPDNTRCVFFQQVMGEIRIIDAIHGGYDDVGRKEGPRQPEEWAQLIKSKPYGYDAHFLPHDGNIKQYTGKSFRNELIQAGLRGVQGITRRGNDPWQYIRPTLGVFERFVFNNESKEVSSLIKHLSMYHTRTENDGVTIQEKPHHDWSSHYADAFGMIIDIIDRGLTGGSGYSGEGGTKKRKRKPRKFRYSAYR